MKIGAERCDVLLIQRSATAFYPATVNQANLLGEAGLKIFLLDGGTDTDQRPHLNQNVTLIRPLAKIERFRNFRFLLACWRALKECNTVCISFDSAASVILGLLPFRGRKIFHFHEYPLGSRNKLNFFAALKADFYDRVAIYFSKRVDLILMADSHRASAYYREHNLNKLPVVINNCPRIIKAIVAGGLRQKLVSQGIDSEFILTLQGSISLYYYVDNIIRSMRYWPADSVLVLVGPVNPDVKEFLTQIAGELGCVERIIFAGRIPYADLFLYSVDADIAFSMVRPISFNSEHCAGASNKRFEAMASGTPQIANKGPGMRELIDLNGIGVCVNAESPAEIGATVAELLADKSRRIKMSLKARSIHLSMFNYEHQFASTLNTILAWHNSRNNIPNLLKKQKIAKNRNF